MNLKSLIKTVPDFPEPGVLFKDISPLLISPVHFKNCIEQLSQIADFIDDADAFVGIESRGFIFASALATKLGKGFVPARKKGKLPPPVISESYSLEYGESVLEIKQGHGAVVLVDDVLATGGTLKATEILCRRAGYDVLGAVVLIDLPFLNVLRINGREVNSLIQYGPGE
ncbi:MAG: adenine phosphoribosyltransferase [Proteobacteria bacterium]|jgi:adenine phosphoribosyltransferase|nr:adenine phosphoribosyltransferase [Pseudomonadota bacterium]